MEKTQSTKNLEKYNVKEKSLDPIKITRNKIQNLKAADEIKKLHDVAIKYGK